jgi:hypothetical protein
VDFFAKCLKEVLEAINKLIETNTYEVSAKRVRKALGVDASDRSTTNFIWRSLKLLEQEGILEKNGSVKPKTYKIPRKKPLDVDLIVKNFENKKKLLR